MTLTSALFSAAERSQVVWTSATAGFHRGAPCVAEDRVLLNLTPEGSVVGARLAAVDRSGRVLWESDERTAMSAEPVVAGGRVYSPSPDGLVCLDARDGSKVWKTDPVDVMGWMPADQDAWDADGGVGRAALSPDGSTVYFALVEGTLVALDAGTGDERWHRAGEHFMNRPAPVVTPDGTVVCNADNGYVTAFSEDGEVRWEEQFGGDVTPPVLQGDSTALFATRGGRLLSVDLATGGTVRQHGLPDRAIRVTPALDPAGRILVASEGAARDGRLHCLEATAEGYREVWTADLPAAARSVAVDPQGLTAVSCGERGVRFFEPDGRSHGLVTGEDAHALAPLGEGTFLANAGHRVKALRPTLQALDAPAPAEPDAGSIEADGSRVTIGAVTLGVRE